MKAPGFPLNSIKVKNWFQSFAFTNGSTCTARYPQELRKGVNRRLPGITHATRTFLETRLRSIVYEGEVGLSLPGVRLVTWTIPAVIQLNRVLLQNNESEKCQP